MDSSDSSSSDNEPKRKRKRFSSMKSEMDSLMRKTRVTASKGSRGNEEKEAHFVKDLFLVAEADAREIPPTVEHASLARSGLGLRCDIQFKSSGSQNHVDRVFKKVKTFPRLREVDNSISVPKLKEQAAKITIQHYSTPSAPVFLKRLSGVKLVVFGPNKEILGLRIIRRRVDAGVDCDLCGRVITNPQWAHHIDKCTERKVPRSQKRKNLLNPWICNPRFKFISISKNFRTIF
uniref:Uncharacterized protein n=1 Tax=Daphnia galeata TaxID=27404 RepID=A0A8J2S8D7_9CRUS|nr:unnamed protein product [Daphnia galeata]